MSRVAYVNGRYVAHRHASVHVEDRGYQFADGVYEVCAVAGGRLVDEGPHLDRLDRSLGAIDMPAPMARPALSHVLHEVVRRNRVRDGMVYLQVTRGVARRDHGWPPGLRPSLVVTARRMPAQRPGLMEQGVAVISQPDLRWRRCDIKAIGLLANVLAKQRARQAGAFEAWLVDQDGFVTEGSSTNAWIVDGEGRLVTRDAGYAILNGVTRIGVIEAARRAGLSIVERRFSIEEARRAGEAFLTSTTSLLLPVVAIDGFPVGDGRPGPVVAALRRCYEEAMLPSCDALA